jgi:integrase
MGVPLAIVSKRMGHSSVAITADLYGHVLRESDDSAAAKTDEYFRRALGS